MATAAGSPFAERRVGERRRVGYASAYGAARVSEGARVSWGGIWGGVLVSMGSLVVLSALGMAVGMTALDPSRADPEKLLTVAGVWGTAALLGALFLGGLVATRIGMVFDRATSFVTGGLVWVINMLLMAVFAGSGLGLVPDFSFDVSSGRAAAWIGVAALLLSLAACVAGAMSGRRGAAERLGRE